MTSLLVSEFKAERPAAVTNGHKPRRRDALMVSAGRWLAHHLPRWEQARSAVMQWSAAGLATWAAVATDPRLGAVVGAGSLITLEYLGRPGEGE